jgi:hypothetical protein
MGIQVGFALIRNRRCALERCQRAIHLRTGDGQTDGAISGWLADHGVAVIDCADAFEACTIALTQPDVQPDVAFVGADWLARDELRVVNYLREIWPDLATVVYGRLVPGVGFETALRTFVCRSDEALQRILEDPPDELLRNLLPSPRPQGPPGDGWRPQPKAPGRPVGAERTAQPTEPAPPGSHSILTAEELTTLLTDDER